MTEEERVLCHGIIHTATAACAALGGGLAQLPMADAIPLTGIQVTMIISLGKVFDRAISETTAQALIKSLGGAAVGRLISQVLVGWIPGLGNFINASTAIVITQALGWKAAEKFDMERE